MRRSLLLLAGALSLGCAYAAGYGEMPAAKPELGAWGVDLSAMDTSVKPGDNFFRFVNGKWLDKTEIPPERSSIGAFQLLRILSEKRMKELVADLQVKPYASLSPEEKKLRDLYEAFVDTKAIEAAGLTPAKPDLARIAKVKTLDDVARAMASPKLGTQSIFNIYIGVDQKDPNAYSVVFTQGGLGMPDRDYYLRDDAALQSARDAYKKYLGDMLALSGVNPADAAKRAEAVYAVEVKIAQAHWSRAENRDEDKTYNPMKVSDLVKFAPDFPWVAFLKEAGVPLKGPKGERVIVVT
ncbi:MAG: hypothetical protein JO294_11055, partial [Alphaproteobacteria bacterium]|nr:hypothetical protein [Alphaproteobacteria bacterium]